MRITGGCHCGAIRYQVEGDPIVHALCHCADCRRHAGAPMVGWAMLPEDAVKVTQGEPKVYASSESGRRQFCAPIAAAGFSTSTPACCPASSTCRAAPSTIPISYPSRCTSRPPNVSAGWSAHTNCRRSSAIRRRRNAPVSLNRPRCHRTPAAPAAPAAALPAPRNDRSHRTAAG